MHIKELGHVVLYVSDLELMADFYRDTLGFPEVTRDIKQGIAVFSSGRTHHELLLIDIGVSPEPRRIRTGLYHIGFKIGDDSEDVQRAYHELKDKGVSIIGASDHTVTHSLYILDPDGNEIELYADVSDAWKKDPRTIVAPIKELKLKL